MPTAKQIGDRVGPYVLTGMLGEGGAGQVFRASWDPVDEDQRADAPSDHPREVAIKLLLASHAESEEIFRRFVREIGVAQKIHHPHLVRHLDSGLYEDVLYYAMELVSYGSLREVLRRRSTLPWRDAAECAQQIAEALGALHSAGVVHRDLKPENVFLSEEGGLKLGDFGLAYKQDESQLTVGGQTVGSVRYMSPEQVCGKRDLDGRCDLYALGCLLFEMVAGRPPFTSTEPMQVFAQHVEQPPPRLREVAPATPASLDELVDRLLAKEKSDRPPSAGGLSSALGAILASESGEVENLTGLLVGEVAPIAPLPEEEEAEESLTGGDDSADDYEDDEPTLLGAGEQGASDLSRRLVEGGGAQGQQAPPLKKVLILVGLLALVGAAVIAFSGDSSTADEKEPPSAQEGL